MSSTTPRMGFYKPASGENINVTTDLNNNWDLIDSNCGFAECTSTTRPSTVWAGLCIFETDTEQTYVSNGTSPASASWINVPNASSTLESSGLNITGSASGDNVLTVKVTGDSNSRLIVEAGGTLYWGDGSGLQDTNLYREQANILKTDDTFEAGSLETDGALNVNGASSGASVLTASVTGDANDRFVLYGDGRFGWGDGTNAVDTILSRSGVGEMTVDNDFVVDGNLTVGGIGQTRFVRKEVSTQRTNTTTLANDSELLLPVDANSIYEVEFWLAVTCNGTNVGIKTAWAVPTGSTGIKSSFGATTNDSNFGGRTDTRVRLGVHQFTTSCSYTVTDSTFHQWCYERGLLNVGATAGDVVLQWAPAALSASFYAEMGFNSYMKILKVG